MKILEIDPDLGAGLDGSSLADAVAASEAEVTKLEPGSWDAPSEVEGGHLGMLVVEGLLARRLTLAGRESVELLAQGDVLRPWVLLGPTSSVATAVSWSVLEPASVADLNADFARRVAPWPSAPA